uniref:developmental pluripotency-associated protein 2 isoform X2 n=1 Tax=Jaculus jaculus TaxID=51337 RepID=UPI001E1B1BF8|nr:developmental pluripotency-associated protein 2 isoform X2 [Jaculus jaculus]
MEDAACDTNKGASREEFSEDSVIITLVPVLQESTVDHPTESSISSMEDINYSVHPKKEFKTPSKPRWKEPVLPLPEILPPIHMVTRNTLRSWCRKHKLSTDGEKIEVYARLQRHAYPEQQCDLPTTSLEAKVRMLPRHKKQSEMVKNKASQKGCNRSAHKDSNVADVVTSPQESTLAAWSRIAARAMEPGAVSSSIPASALLQKASGFRWCVVHGKLLPANVSGWVRLQFRAGYTWVPHTHRKMIALFLLPACVFPSQEMEDNMLCPECVQSNKKIMKRLTKKKTQPTSEDCSTLSSRTPSCRGILI